jgi:hypothetical protein
MVLSYRGAAFAKKAEGLRSSPETLPRTADPLTLTPHTVERNIVSRAAQRG